MPDFINTEHCVEKLFPVGTTFSFEGKKYQVALCGKPRPARGECKTDVYIKGIAPNGEAKEIKISVKQKNAAIKKLLPRKRHSNLLIFSCRWNEDLSLLPPAVHQIL